MSPNKHTNLIKNTSEPYYPVKGIIRRKINAKNPFLIEWDTIDPSEPSWEPWENLSQSYQKKYYKNGKIRKVITKEKKKKKKKKIVALNKKRKPKRTLPEEKNTVISAKRPREESETNIPAKSFQGTVERKGKRRKNKAVIPEKSSQETLAPKQKLLAAKENEAILPTKRSNGTVEYSEYENEIGECVLVQKTYFEDHVKYQHFRRVSRVSI